jgi:hypothetical protein
LASFDVCIAAVIGATPVAVSQPSQTRCGKARAAADQAPADKEQQADQRHGRRRGGRSSREAHVEAWRANLNVQKDTGKVCVRHL